MAKIRTQIIQKIPTKEENHGFCRFPHSIYKIPLEPYDDHGLRKPIIQSAKNPWLGREAGNALFRRRNFRDSDN